MGIGENVKGIVQGFFDKVEEVFTAITDFFAPAAEWFSQLFGSISQTIQDIWNNLIVFFRGIWLKNTFSKAWEGVKNVFSTGGKIFSGKKGIRGRQQAAQTGSPRKQSADTQDRQKPISHIGGVKNVRKNRRNI